MRLAVPVFADRSLAVYVMVYGPIMAVLTEPEILIGRAPSIASSAVAPGSV